MLMTLRNRGCNLRRFIFGGNMMKQLFAITAIYLFSSTLAFSNSEYAKRVNQKLQDPLLNQGIINERNVEIIDRLGQNYPKMNTINVGWLSLFRRYNSSETMQNRTALNNLRSDNQMIFDMDGTQPVDWNKVRINKKK